MNSRACFLLAAIFAASFVAAGCAVTTPAHEVKIYTCPKCKSVVPATSTLCPTCGQRLTPVDAAPVATVGPAASPTQAAPTQGKPRREVYFPPVKIGPLFQLTDSNHQRITPFISIELLSIEQGEELPVICFDAGVAQEAVFASAGVRRLVPELPNFGFFLFVMLDWSPTVKYRGLGHKDSAHFCSGFGITLAGF